MPSLTPRFDAVDRPTLRASEGAGTTTLTSSDTMWQVFSLSAARTVVLPSTGILAGQLLRIDNVGAFELTIQSSNLTTMTQVNVAAASAGDPTIYQGSVVLMAMQATPTTPAHWRVVEVFEQFTLNGTPIMMSGGGSVGSGVGVVKFGRTNNLASIHAKFSGTISGTVNGAGINSFVPARFRPNASWVNSGYGQGSQTVGAPTGSLAIQLYHTGQIILWNTTNFTNNGTGFSTGAWDVSAFMTYMLPITI